MFKQITPTFAPVSTTIFDNLNDEFLMKNSQQLTRIMLERNMPLDFITKLVKKNIILYNEMKYKNDEMIADFTAENFIEVLKMKFDSV